MAIAAAQEAPPRNGDAVLAAYRDYRAALEAGDDDAAAAAADLAWRASEARDGDGGRTAVLAYNAAKARMTARQRAEALAPARRASALADAGAEGVDPLHARLQLGAILAWDDSRASYREAAGLLEPLLQQARALESAETRMLAHEAAKSLAVAAARQRNWREAQTAWEAAFDLADNAQDNVEVARAEALIGRGISFVARRQDAQAHEVFAQAMAHLAPLAPEREDDQLMMGEYLLAQAYGWLSAVQARMDEEAPRFSLPRRPTLPGRPPICDARVRIEPLPRYPRDALWGMNVGSVVVKISTDSEGRVLQHRVLASIPSENFAEALDDERLNWSVTRSPDAPAGCRMESKSHLIPVRFVIR